MNGNMILEQDVNLSFKTNELCRGGKYFGKEISGFLKGLSQCQVISPTQYQFVYTNLIICKIKKRFNIESLLFLSVCRTLTNSSSHFNIRKFKSDTELFDLIICVLAKLNRCNNRRPCQHQTEFFDSITI